MQPICVVKKFSNFYVFSDICAYACAYACVYACVYVYAYAYAENLDNHR